MPDDAQPAPVPSARRRKLHVALLALIAYALLAAWELRTVLDGDLVLSSSAMVVRAGPYTQEFRALSQPGIDLLADSARQFTPWMLYAAQHLASDGELPLWKTTASCGAPLVGNGQSALFFPTRLLAVLLGAPPWVHAGMAGLRLIVAAFGGYLLLRHLRAGALAAWLGGLVFGFGGFLIVFRLHPHADAAALLPWLVLAADRLALRPSPRRIGWVALLAGLQWLAGHPQTAVHCQTTVTLLVLARAWSQRRAPDGPGLLRPLLAFVAALLLGLAIAALQLGPLAEYASLSESNLLRHAYSAFGALREPWLAAGFVAALLAGAAALTWLARGRAVLLPALLLLLASVAALRCGLRSGLSEIFLLLLSSDWFGGPTAFMGQLNYVEGNGAYVGAALPLAAAGLLFGRPRGAVRAAGLCALIGVLAGFRAPALMAALRTLPLIGLADNGRLVLIGLLGLAVLAGLGLDGLSAAAGRRAARLRLLGAALLPALAAWGVVAWGVMHGEIGASDEPGGTRAPLDVARFGLMAPQYASLVREIEAREPLATLQVDPPTDDEHLEVLGFAAVRQPITSAQVIYSSRNLLALSRWCRVPEKQPLPGSSDASALPDRWYMYVFRAAIPRAGLPPEFPQLRVRVATKGSGVLHSSLLTAYEPTEITPLLFPAQPAPPPADGGMQLRLLAIGLLLAVLACGRPAAGFGLAVQLVLAAAVAASLLSFGETMVPTVPRDLFYPMSGGFLEARRVLPDGRVVVMEVYGLGAEVPTAWGLPDVRGYDALTPPRIALLLRAGLDWPDRATAMELLPARTDPDLRVLGLLSVRELLDWEQAPDTLPRVHWAGERRLQQYLPFPIIQNPQALPRARLVSRAVVQPDDAAALALLRTPGFDVVNACVLADAAGVPPELLAQPGALLVAEAEDAELATDAELALAEPPPEPPEPTPWPAPTAAGSARFALDTPDRIRLDIEPAAPALLVLSDTDFPGWRAFVDGVERPITRANIAFRAVPVAPGEREVEFRYEPRSYYVGEVITLIALALVYALLTWVGKEPQSTRA